MSLKHFGSLKEKKAPAEGYFPVSILKPLKGMEYKLEENLESFFNLDYPDYELLFALTNEADPALSVVQKVIKKYPHIKASITIHPDRGFGNPKISNMLQIFEDAKNDWILISDSNSFAEKDFLKKYVNHVGPNVGMVSAHIGGFESTNFFGKLESVFLNGFYTRWGLFVKSFGKPCVVGKMMLFQRSVVNRMGGIRAFSHHIAEDYMMGEAVRHLGYQVVMASTPAPQRVGSVSFSQFWGRHMRWGRIRKQQAPAAFFLFEPVFGLFAAAAYGGISLNAFFGWNPFAVAAAHLSAWAVGDYLITKKIDSKISLNYFFYWFARECLQTPLWFHIASGNTVKWRGQILILEGGGMVRPSEQVSEAEFRKDSAYFLSVVN